MGSEIVTQNDPRRDVLSHIAQALRLLAEAVEAQAPPDILIKEDRLLTPVEAADRLRRSRAYITSKCRSGAIKAMRDGGWRIRESALENFERRRTR